MIVLGIIQFFLIGFICIYEFKKKSTVVFAWATLLIMFGVTHLITSFIGDQEYSDDVINHASLFVIGFCSIYWVTRILIGSKDSRASIEQWNKVVDEICNYDSAREKLVILFGVVIFVLLFPYVRSVGNIMNTSWGNGRAYTATLSYANYLQPTRVLFSVLSGVGIACWLAKKRGQALFVALLLLVNVIISRNRIEVLPLLCSVIAIVIILTKRIRFSTIIGGALAAIAAIYIVYGLRVFRHYGTLQDFIDQFALRDFISKINLYLKTDNGELGLRKVFYYFIDNDNQFKNFGKLHSYIRMLLVFIPTRFSFGLKPPDFAISMGRAVGMGEGGSTHPTLFGDCYANLGDMGVFLGAFWALYASLADHIIVKQKNVISKCLLYILFAVAYTIMGRGSVYNPFFDVAYGVVLITAFSYLQRRVKFK